MIEFFIGLAITGLIVLGLYIAAFFFVWQGLHFIEQLKRRDDDDWEA